MSRSQLFRLQLCSAIPVRVGMLLCVFAFVSTSTEVAAQSHRHSQQAREARKKAFEPWSAGSKRAVTRQGQKGRDRVAHPFVGDAGKVPGEGPSPPPLKRDVDVPETALDRANRIGSSLSSNPLWLASLVYSNFLTRMDGPRCHHYPTCSRFGSQAVAKHKVMGLFLGLDRIIQPPVSSSIRGLPSVSVYGASRSFDPLRNYEFWRPELFTGFPPATEEEPLPEHVVTDAAQPAASSKAKAKAKRARKKNDDKKTSDVKHRTPVTD